MTGKWLGSGADAAPRGHQVGLLVIAGIFGYLDDEASHLVGCECGA